MTRWWCAVCVASVIVVARSDSKIWPTAQGPELGDLKAARVMNGTPIRGVVLVALAALVGYLILAGVTDRQEIPLTAGAQAALPTAVPTADTQVDPADLVDATGTTDAIDDNAAPLPTAPPVLDTSTARPNAQVSVLVANGTAVPGQAGRLTDVLRNQGFNTRQPKNSDDRPSSVIYHRPGFDVEAQKVRDLLQSTDTPIAPMPVPDPVVGADIDLGPVDVFVYIGNDNLATQ